MGVALDAEVLYGLPKGVFMGSKVPPKSYEKNLDRKLMSTYFYMYVSNYRKRKKNYPT